MVHCTQVHCGLIHRKQLCGGGGREVSTGWSPGTVSTLENPVTERTGEGSKKEVQELLTSCSGG